jgi:hypothetical protein
LPAQIPPDIARYAAILFDRAPKEAFDTLESLAIMHIRSYICLGLPEKAIELAEFYEKRYLKLPENSVF